MLGSGYSKGQTRGVFMAGLKGYDGRRRRCREKGRDLHRNRDETQAEKTLQKESRRKRI